MKTIYKSFKAGLYTLLVAAAFPAFNADAQQLELYSGSNTTAGNGPYPTNAGSVNTTLATATLYQNTGNSATFSAFSPTTTVSIEFANQQYTSAAYPAFGLTYPGLFGGATISSGNPVAAPIFRSILNTGTGANSDYASAPFGTSANNDFSVTNNYSFTLCTWGEYLERLGTSTSARPYIGDIVIRFSRPVMYPVIHIEGIGGAVTTSGNRQAFCTELELSTADVSAGLTLTRTAQSPSGFFTVNSTSVVNNSTVSSADATTDYGDQDAGHKGSGGSFRVNSAASVTTVTFRVYLRGKPANGSAVWGSSGTTSQDTWNLSVSLGLQGVSGNVFDDPDGLVNSTVDGTGTNAGGLFALLVDESGKVFASATVAANGSYSFASVPTGSYTVQLSTVTGTVGNTPPAVSIPANWVNTGENLGTGAGSDGTVDGKLAVVVSNADVTNANFGIERLSTADPKTATITQPTANQFITLNGVGANPPIFTGSDPEDQPASGTLSGKTVRITSLPSNGQLWYNGVQITATGNLPANFSPALLQFRATGSGYNSTVFRYAYVDAAGVSGTDASYTISWAIPLPLSLLSFNGEARQCMAGLSWTTSGSETVTGFEIQRSNNGTDFRAVGVVAASTERRYSWSTPLEGETVSYFRLALISNEQAAAYSATIALKPNCFPATGIRVFPNPVAAALTISGAEEGGMIRIYAMDGRLLQATAVSDRKMIVDISYYLPAAYQVVVTDKAGVLTCRQTIRKL